MATDVTFSGALQRRRQLEERQFLAAHGTLHRTSRATAEDLFREIRSYLLNASDQRLIAESPKDVRSSLVLSSKSIEAHDETHLIAVGSPRNFRRDPSRPHYTRTRDGWWFDFQLGVREAGNKLDVLSYDFEIRPPPVKQLVRLFTPAFDIILATHGFAPFPFLRFDLNPPDHANAKRELRSHVHLGVDDDGFSIPCPVMSPFEILDVFIHGLQRTGRVRRVA